MTLYIIKFSLVFACLLIFYKMAFENERTFVFNRFFLLFSLAFSLLIPILTVTVNSNFAELPLNNITGIYDFTSTPTAEIVSSSEAVNSINYKLLSLYTYLSIVLLLTIRFALNLGKIIIQCRKTDKFVNDRYHFVLSENNILPNSFFNFIFLNKAEFESGNIAKAIIDHEKRHADAYHSVDVILMEILLIIFWFNPIVYWFKKTMLLNHEFFADVQSRHNNLKYYQRLIFSQMFKNKANTLASGFNYSFIKKRMKMLHKHKSGPLLRLKQSFLLPILVALSIAACNKVISQDQNSIQSVESEEREMMTFLNGKAITDIQYYHIDYADPINGKQVSSLIRSSRVQVLDNLTFTIAGKNYEAKDLISVQYLENKKELAKRDVNSESSILVLSNKRQKDGTKFRSVKLSNGSNTSITYDDHLDQIPLPPPPPPAPAAPSVKAAPTVKNAAPTTSAAPTAPTKYKRVYKSDRFKQTDAISPPPPPLPTAPAVKPAPVVNVPTPPTPVANVPAPPSPTENGFAIPAPPMPAVPVVNEFAIPPPPPPAPPSIEDLKVQIEHNNYQIELLSKAPNQKDQIQIEKYKLANSKLAKLIEKHKKY